MSDALGQLIAGALLLLFGGIGFALGYHFGRARSPDAPEPPSPRRPRRRTPSGPAEVLDISERRPKPPERLH